MARLYTKVLHQCTALGKPSKRAAELVAAIVGDGRASGLRLTKRIVSRTRRGKPTGSG